VIAPRIGSLFSGSGMLDEGVRSVLGGTVAWHVENDPAASKVLAHRYPDVPNHGDVTTTDWAAVEPVDVITGGSPCQDVSAAGKRQGMRAGTRSGLWASMCDAIDIIRPRLVVWENVRGVLSATADSSVEPCPFCVGDGRGAHLRALGRVVGDLSELGYDAEWVGLRASDVGAAHGRFRVFVLARPAADTSGVGHEWFGGARDGRPGPAHRRGAAVPHAVRTGAGRDARAVSGEAPPARRPGVDVHAAVHAGAGVVQWGELEPAIRRWERILGRPAPHPVGIGSKGQPKLSAQFDEWLMGWPEGWASDVPGVTWNDVLAMCGNGVVPQHAAAAVRHLLARLDVSLERAA
jgi:DNA (cytosine-5)-methyltransferase 1